MRTLVARTRVRAMAIAAGMILVAAATASPASAATGTAELTLNGAGAKALRGSGVRIVPTGAAKGGARRVTLPIRTGLVGSTATLVRLGGGVSLSRGKRRVKLAGLRISLGRRALLTGKIGGERADLFRLRGGRRQLDGSRGSISLSGLRLMLTREAAKEIGARLELRQAPPRRFGLLSAREEGLLTGGETPSGPGAQASGCPLPGSAGPAPEEPLPVAARPPGAVDVTAATISWDVRESFIRYVNTGEGTSVFDGAVAAAPQVRPGSSTPLTYRFGFPLASGWHDSGANPVDPADDRAAIYFSGGVRFLYSAHGIDLRTSQPELEIAGDRSRAIFAVADGEGAPQRQVIVNLDLGAAAAVQTSGSSVTYERVPGAIPSGTASSVFGGFYTPGTDFGCFTVSYSTGS